MITIPIPIELQSSYPGTGRFHSSGNFTFTLTNFESAREDIISSLSNAGDFIDFDFIQNEVNQKDTVRSIDSHSDSELIPASAPDGTECVIIGGKLIQRRSPIIIESTDWTTTTRDIDTPILQDINSNPNSNLKLDYSINIPETGFWKPTISFMYAHDSTGSDFVALCNINGDSIAKCNPISERIKKTETKDSAGTNPDNTNAGTSQVHAYTMVFNSSQLSAGPNQIQLIYGSDSGDSVEASMGELTIKLERVYNIINI